MRLFAIGDLHMSGGDDKPMDVFGPQWDRHFLRISENWRRVVSPEDTVLIPGDISWAMQLENAIPDLEEIGKLPGRKILCKGNHEYWWSSISRIRAALPEGMTALQFDAADLGDYVVCGTRGWMFPTEKAPLAPQDEKICAREAQRLSMALDAADRLGKGRPVIVMTHYPPLLDSDRDTVFTRILEGNPRVKAVVYGHLHGAALANAFDGEKERIRYYAVPCDGIDFCPREIMTGNS
ncbi:MAG: metallophosphoesterase [Clostridiales bacterium]|nr:metallophosphoesterase [Clostridiales bacterium]